MKKYVLAFISWFIIFLLVPIESYASPNIKIVKVNPHNVRSVPSKVSCLSSTITLSGATNWYAPATLTIINNCSSPQKLNNAVVSFQSNSNNISAMWGGANSSADFTYKGNIASTVLLINSDPLLIGKKLVLNFGINLTGTPFDLASANSTLSVITNTPTPLDGEIDITIDPTGVVGYSDSAEIDVTGPGLIQPYVIQNTTWGSATIFKITGLAHGTYTISPQAIPNLYQAKATPATVNVASSTPVTSQVSYTALPPTGALQVNLSAAPLANIASSVKATLTDNTTSQSQTITVNWGGFALIQNLIAGDNYTLTFPEVTNGVSYSDPDPITSPIILQGRTTPVAVSYQQAQPVPSQSVAINVTGLASGVQGALTIVDGFGNTFNVTNLNNGQASQALPVNDTFSVTASAPGMFGTVSPASFTLVNGGTPPALTVQFSVNPPPLNLTTFFAYADSGTQSNYVNNHNAMKSGLIPPTGGSLVEAFILYTNGKADLWAITQGDAVSQYIKNTPNTFASVGGANGPYPWDYETVAQGVKDIEALVDYYGFIGIDFDVEGAALETPSVQTWVSQAVLQLHKDRPNLLLTLTVPDPILGFTTGTEVIINQTFDKVNNKWAFNWVNKMDFDEAGLDQGANCTQTSTDMNKNCLVISASSGATRLAQLLNLPSAQAAYPYLGLIFMVPIDDQGHQLSLSLATTIASTVHNMGVGHLGYWSLQRDTNLSYGNMFTHTLGLS